MKHDPSDDALEAELQSLRPRELPGRLVRRIEASLAGEAPRTRSPWLKAAAAVVGLAACVALVAFFWRGGRGVAVPQDPPVAVIPTPPADRRGGGVTLAEYRAALLRSPEAVDALLERDAPLPPLPARRAAGFRAFHGSASDVAAPDEP